jgi:hypothetical protein
MAPLQLAWFSFLEKHFPTGELGAAIWKVLFDQIIFSPLGGVLKNCPNSFLRYAVPTNMPLTGLALFFVFMTVTEGGGSKAVRKKFDGIYVSALKSNYVVWPAVQILNFRVIPLQFQLVGFFRILSSTWC